MVVRRMMLELEEKTESLGWDAPPILIEVRETDDMLTTWPVASSGHPVDMMVETFRNGWRPSALVIIAEGTRTMVEDEAVLLSEWEDVPEYVKENWLDVIRMFTPSEMKPFVIEVRTVLYVDAQDRELMLIRDRGQEPRWINGEDVGQISQVARDVVRGVQPLV